MKQIEYICHDKNCGVCDYENLKEYMGADELKIKETSGASGSVHPDIIKKWRSSEKNQKLLVDKAENIYDNILKSLDILHELAKLYDESNKMDLECEKFEKKYPFCKRVWQGDEQTHIKLKSHTYDISEIEHNISEILKHFYQ